MTQYHNTVKDDTDIKAMLLDKVSELLDKYMKIGDEITHNQIILEGWESKLPIWEKLHNRVVSIKKDKYSYVNTSFSKYLTGIRSSIIDLKERLTDYDNDRKDIRDHILECEEVLQLYGIEDLETGLELEAEFTVMEDDDNGK